MQSGYFLPRRDMVLLRRSSRSPLFWVLLFVWLGIVGCEVYDHLTTPEPNWMEDEG